MNDSKSYQQVIALDVKLDEWAMIRIAGHEIPSAELEACISDNNKYPRTAQDLRKAIAERECELRESEGLPPKTPKCRMIDASDPALLSMWLRHGVGKVTTEQLTEQVGVKIDNQQWYRAVKRDIPILTMTFVKSGLQVARSKTAAYSMRFSNNPNDVWFLDATPLDSHVRVMPGNNKEQFAKVRPATIISIADGFSGTVVCDLFDGAADRYKAAVVILSAIVQLGIPQMIVTDRGGEFDNEHIKDLCAAFGFDLVVANRADPELKGLVGVGPAAVHSRVCKPFASYTGGKDTTRKVALRGNNRNLAPWFDQARNDVLEQTARLNATTPSRKRKQGRSMSPNDMIAANPPLERVTDDVLKHALKWTHPYARQQGRYKVTQWGVEIHGVCYTNLDEASIGMNRDTNGAESMRRFRSKEVVVRQVPGDPDRIAIYTANNDEAFIAFLTRHDKLPGELGPAAANTRSR